MGSNGRNVLLRAVKTVFTVPNARQCHTSQTRGLSTSNGEKEVETEKIGNVFLVGINRPEVRNCVNPTTANQLVDAFKEFEQTDNLWVAVLYGRGGCFCAGYDLKHLSTEEEVLPPTHHGSTELQEWRPMGPSMIRFSKPVIAAVAGYAVAGGLELAAMCDLRVVEESAQMGVFCRRWGVPLVDGGTLRLPKLIGLSRALDLILTGRAVSAQEALQFGLANRVVPDGTAVGEAVKLAQSLCKFPQQCMRADRKSAYYSAYDASDYNDAFQVEWQQGSKVIQTESVQGAKRFKDGIGRHGSFSFSDPKSKL